MVAGIEAKTTYATMVANANAEVGPRGEVEQLRARMQAAQNTVVTKRYGIDAAEFLAIDDEESDPFLVQGIIPEGMPTMIVGPPKSRKSWVNLYLAVCIAAGVPAFGRRTTRGRVLVIAREDTARETRRRIRLIMRALKIEAEHLRGWLRVDSTQPLYLDNLDDANALGHTLTEFRPSVVFIDSLSRIHSRDENSRTDMQPVMNMWADLCTFWNCSVVLLHHMPKWTKGTVIQNIRGSGDIGAVVRVAIGVTRVDKSTSQIEVDGNLADMAPKFHVRFSDLDAAGKEIAANSTVARHAIALAVVGSGVGMTDPLSDPLVGDIAVAMFEHGGTMSVIKIRKGRGGKDLVDRAIDVLVENGLALKAMRGRRHEGYYLTEAGKVFAGANPYTSSVNAGSGIVAPSKREGAATIIPV
jgi:archaellum biogenesis ATPase FlaH